MKALRGEAEAQDVHVSRCDVLVIGGGPGGATIATLLAERGYDVVMLEKSRHPRFHIGESLLPHNTPMFRKLGVADEIKRIGMPKFGAEFVSPWHDKSVTFDFSGALDKSLPSAYQVRRSEFDEILFRNAIRKGARTVEKCRATSVAFCSDGARVTSVREDGLEQTWQTKFVVDASGRDTLLAKQLGTKQRDKRHNSAAIYGHFSDAIRLEGKAEGNISMFWFEHGWFWFIPLSDGTTSVGAVCWPYYMQSRRMDPEKFFFDTIKLSPALQMRLRDAKLVSSVMATGNYSYEAGRASGRNYLMLGDAFAFVDPVFSTGVFLAMHSAFVGADTVGMCLENPRRAASALNAFDAAMRRGPKIFSWFIHRLTMPAMRYLFMNPSNKFGMQSAVLSMLAGDIFRGTPLTFGLLMFKTVYYLKSLLSPVQSLAAWRRRQLAIREPGTESR